MASIEGLFLSPSRRQGQHGQSKANRGTLCLIRNVRMDLTDADLTRFQRPDFKSGAFMIKLIHACSRAVDPSYTGWLAFFCLSLLHYFVVFLLYTSPAGLCLVPPDPSTPECSKSTLRRVNAHEQPFPHQEPQAVAALARGQAAPEGARQESLQPQGLGPGAGVHGAEEDL